jgi:STAS-like domain of unknown function (DUF4325)
MINPIIALQPHTSGRMLGVRSSALPLRDQIEQVISEGREVTIDFSGVEATQSFVDELIGVIVASQGPSVLDRVVFKGCSPTVKGILQFVVSDRADQFIKSRH